MNSVQLTAALFISAYAQTQVTLIAESTTNTGGLRSGYSMTGSYTTSGDVFSMDMTLTVSFPSTTGNVYQLYLQWLDPSTSGSTTRYDIGTCDLVWPGPTAINSVEQPTVGDYYTKSATQFTATASTYP